MIKNVLIVRGRCVKTHTCQNATAARTKQTNTQRSPVIISRLASSRWLEITSPIVVESHRPRPTSLAYKRCLRQRDRDPVENPAAALQRQWAQRAVDGPCDYTPAGEVGRRQESWLPNKLTVFFSEGHTLFKVGDELPPSGRGAFT